MNDKKNEFTDKDSLNVEDVSGFIKGLYKLLDTLQHKFDILPKVLESKEKFYVYKLKSEVWGIDRPEFLDELINRKWEMGKKTETENSKP